MKRGAIIYKKRVYYNPIFVKILKFFIPLILFFMNTKIKCIKGKIPDKGHLLISAHHEEKVDQFIIGLAIKRRLFWVADTTPPDSKICLADTKFMRWLMLRLGAIPIDKKNNKRNKNLFDYLSYLLEKGEAVVFFPEAYVRSERNDKKFGKFKDGVVRLALEYEKRFNEKIPIFPVGLRYAKDKKIKKVCLNIGCAFLVKNRKDKT